ncbi:transmembrane proteins 14C-domain-containing protein [Podospora conica]|nr:transmembrane proteins 14C-domain-containing protein [Schizothecium conicum]
MGLELPAYVLAALTAGGGIIGFVKTRSKPSIIAGVSVGLLYGLGGLRIQNAESMGVELALLASVVLGGSSIPRALKGRKPIPVALSALATYGMYVFGDEFRRGL